MDTVFAIVSALVVALLIVKFLSNKKEPPYCNDDSPVGPYKSVRMFMKGNSGEGVLFSEGFDSLLSMLGIRNYFITDPDTARKIFTGDGANGHHEMRRFWYTTVEYRNRMYPDRPPLDSSGIGILRNMDSNNPKETAIAKLARKRLMDTLAPRSGKTRLDIEDQVPELIEELLRISEENPLGFDVMDGLMGATVNIILKATTGRVLEQQGEKMAELCDCLNKGVNALVRVDPKKLAFIMLPPIIRRFIPLSWWPSYCLETQRLYDIVIDDFIAPHEANWQPNDDVTSLLDAVTQDLHDGKLNKSDLIHTILISLLGGGDTTSTAFRNVLINLSKSPDLQETIYNELAEVDFRLKSLSDVPLLAATVSESMRFTPSLYRSLFHTTTKSMEIAGYGPFPVETLVSCSISGICMNENFFPNPRKFDPNRFLKDGKVKTDRNFIPFSVGLRRCPGENLAMTEQFVFIVAILQNFKLTNDVRLTSEGLTEEQWLGLWDPNGYAAKDGHFLMPKNPNIMLTAR